MGNFSIDPKERLKKAKQNEYTAVRLQQGVPLLDADWNEMDDIRREQIYALVQNCIGDGVLGDDYGFRIAPTSPESLDFTIKAGVYLVGGRVINNPTDVKYSELRDPDTGGPLPGLKVPRTATEETVFLDVWEKEAQEDDHPVYRKIGVSSCVRLKTVWVVRVGIPALKYGHSYCPLARLSWKADDDRLAARCISGDFRKAVRKATDKEDRISRAYKVPLLRQAFLQNERTITLSGHPTFIAFDGKCMWIGNHGSSIDVVNAVTDVKEVEIGLPDLPWRGAFTGKHIWVTGGDAVTAIDVASRTPSNPVHTGMASTGAAYDGEQTVWVVNQNESSVSLVDITSLRTKKLAIPSQSQEIVFDGNFMWIISQYSVAKIHATNHSIEIVDVRGDGRTSPEIGFDGEFVWIITDGTVKKIHMKTNAVTSTLTTLSFPSRIAFDGTCVWISSTGSNMIYIIEPVTNEVVAKIPTTAPTTMAFDGTFMWVCSGLENKVAKIRKLV